MRQIRQTRQTRETGKTRRVRRVGETVLVNDRMQRGYAYVLTAKEGEDFAANFAPFFSPPHMLELGVFEGKYLNDCRAEFPARWFARAKLSARADAGANYFRVKSRQSLAKWRENGWLIGDDVRGWFQWYCRYYLGRRVPAADAKQIARWRAFARHAGQVRANCIPGDLDCRPRQRQALLQWSHNPFI